MRWTKHSLGCPSGWLWAAGVIGLLNALPSWYWGAGGAWLLPSIGQWLIQWRAESPLLVGAGLFTVAAGKTVLAALPLVCRYVLDPLGRTAQFPGARSHRGTRVWTVLWTLCGVAAILLVVYGTLGLTVNVGLLAWPGHEVVDPTARWGQALVWYPMLMVWGVALGCGYLAAGLSAGNTPAAPDQRDL